MKNEKLKTIHQNAMDISLGQTTKIDAVTKSMHLDAEMSLKLFPKRNIDTCKNFEREEGCILVNCPCEKQETIEEPKQRLEKYSERFDNDKSPIGNPETWGKRLIEETIEEAAEKASELQEGTYTPQHKVTYSHGFIDGYKLAIQEKDTFAIGFSVFLDKNKKEYKGLLIEEILEIYKKTL